MTEMPAGSSEGTVTQWILAAITVLGVAFVTWLKLARGVMYVWNVPTMVIFIAPQIAAIWLPGGRKMGLSLRLTTTPVLLAGLALICVGHAVEAG